MDAISAFQWARVNTLKVVPGDIGLLVVATFPSALPYFECRDHCSLRKRTQCNLYVFPSGRNPLGGGSSRQLSVCKGVSVPFRLDLKSRWSNGPPPPWPLPRPLLHISMDASLSLHLYIMAAAAQRVRARSTAHQPSDSARQEKRGEMRRNHLHPLLIHRLYLTPQPQASLR